MTENYPITPKRSSLDLMMQEVANCRKCTTEEGGIAEDKRLVNLIAGHPNPPCYGEIPSHFTDWAYRHRLDAKIAMVMQDWGSADHPQFGSLVLRKDYEDLLRHGPLSREAAFREIVQNRPPHHLSKTQKNLTVYLRSSAQKEGLSLPKNFLDHIYFTNAVLCFRRGNPKGTTNIDLSKSIKHCCSSHRFLHRQLSIVNPSVVVALGKKALKGFSDGSKEVRLIEAAADSTTAQGWRNGYIEIGYYDLRLNFVFVPHPAAYRKLEDQIQDYRRIWMALRSVRGPAVSDLVTNCFPKS